MIHKFEIDGTKIVLDVNSGAVHEMDGLAWDIVDDYTRISTDEIIEKYRERYSFQEVQEVLDEIGELKLAGILFSEDKFKADALNYNGEPVVKSLCLNVSHDCNLRCRYCFAGSGHFGGDRALMPTEIGKRALDFLLEKSAGRRHLEVDFFGGEPLMNIDTVKELVFYGRTQAAKKGKEIKFTLTTNALLLNEAITEFLNTENISVVLSLDGRESVNDAMRLTAGGNSGSYSVITPKISTFIESRNNENYFVRGTYTRFNTDFSQDVAHLADLGYKYISVEPVVGPLSEDWSLKEDDLPRLFSEYDALTREYAKRLNDQNSFEFFHFNLDLNNGPCIPKRLSGCGAGFEYMAVTPEGDLYPCHQFVGRENYKLGNVWEGITKPEIPGSFRQAHIYNKKECCNCWAKYHCGGGCHANAESVNEDIMKPYHVGCELEKKRLECAIYIQVLKARY